MSKAFNILDEKWLPVRYVDGSTADLGLIQVFADAHKISGLADTAPPNLIAQYRLLLAIVHRAFSFRFQRWSSNDMARCYQEGLPVEAIVAYLEHWRERFWLFHPTLPFMQVALLAEVEATRERNKPCSQIILAAASGNAPVLFDHTVDTRPEPLDPAAALRHLLGFLQFTPGGLVRALRTSDNGGALANTAAALPMGDCLGRTLCLALHPVTRAGQEDLPAWELPAPTLSQLVGAATLATGANDRYTRLSRSVLLTRDEAGGDRVTALRFAEGLALAEDEQARDPMASWRAGSVGLVRLNFAEGRALWRDLGALLPDASGQRSVPAAVLGWAAQLLGRVSTTDTPALPILVAGLTSDQAKLLRWRLDGVAMPEALLQTPDAADLLRDRLQEIERVFGVLKGILVDMQAATMPDAAHKETRATARRMVEEGPAPQAYFSALERAFPQLLALTAQPDPDAVLAAWNHATRIAVERAWSSMTMQLGGGVAAIRARARAEGRYLGLLAQLRPTPVLPDQEILP